MSDFAFIKPFKRRNCTGSTLIEVLVTMVIIALGLLGQAAVLIHSSKSSNSAFMRSQATLLAYDMIERMRLNRALAINKPCTFCTDFATPAANVVVKSSDFSTSELKSWKSNVESMLPGGQALVNVLTNGGTGAGTYTVQIQIKWNDLSKGTLTSAAVDTTTFTTESVI